MTPVIQIQNLSKTYKVHLKQEGLLNSLKALFKRKYKFIEAVKEINFEIEEGELVGFIGPNGAGKTTTLKMLSGLLYPTSGIAKVLEFTPFERKEEYLKQISLVMGQKNQLWWDLPAIETFNLNKEIYEIPADQYKKILEELLTMLELKDIVNQQVRKLSLGERMKCELVAALIHTPKVLFLDEPTIGLDVVMQKKIREFLKEYNRKHRATIILTSHYMDDVKEVCKRIIMIDHGKLLYDGSLNEMIKKYADYKILVPIFNEKVGKEQLESIGAIKEYSPHKAVILVDRDKVSEKASEILSKFDVDDLDINEPRLEDIVSEQFSS